MGQSVLLSRAKDFRKVLTQLTQICTEIPGCKIGQNMSHTYLIQKWVNEENKDIILKVFEYW